AAAEMVCAADSGGARRDGRECGRPPFALATVIRSGHESVCVRACVSRVRRPPTAPISAAPPAGARAHSSPIGHVGDGHLLRSRLPQPRALHQELSTSLRPSAVACQGVAETCFFRVYRNVVTPAFPL